MTNNRVQERAPYQLKDFRYTMESCNHCGQCKWLLGPKTKGYDFAEICPIHKEYHFDAYSGQGLIHIARELLDGDLAYEDGMMDLVYSCTMCGACDINCKSIRDMEVLDTILALREQCVADGQGPMPVQREWAANVRDHNNLYGRPHEQRFDWMPQEQSVNDACSVAYFVGCTAAYLHPQIARDTARILTAGGLDFKVLGPEEHCCGGPLWRTGQRAAAKHQVEHNMRTLKDQGIDMIITSCAECFGAFRGFYPRVVEMDIKVAHISEVIREMLVRGDLSLTRPVGESVTYHDPCLLGRLSEPYVPWNGTIQSFGYHEPPKEWRRGTHGVYDAPREVLSAIPGLQLREMVRNEENSFCCGAGGGVGAAFPEFARVTATERLREAESTGAGTVVSACPFCQSTFEDAIQAGQRPIRYLDLTRIVAMALPDNESGKE